MKRVRLAAATAAGLMLLTTGITLADPGDELVACRSTLNGKPQVTIRPDRWVRIAVPKFDAGDGPATITSFAAMPQHKNGLIVTNGQVVKLSVDAGCTWQNIFTGSTNINAPAPGYTPGIVTQVVEPSDTSAWLTSYDNVDGVPHPHVFIGSGIGSGTPSFSQNDVGLPAYGKPVSLVVPFPGLGEAYLLLDELPDAQSGVTSASRHLYETTAPNPQQAGAVAPRPWNEVTLPSGFGPVDGVAREAANKIWIWSGNHYAWTADATTTASSGPQWVTGTLPGRILTIDIDSGGGVNIIEQLGAKAIDVQPTAQNGIVERMALPVVPQAFAHGALSDVFVESGAKGTWGYDHLKQKWIDITPRGGPSFPALTMAQGTSARIVLGETSSALWRWDTYADETFVRPPPPPPSNGPPPTLPHSNLKAPVLTPTKQVVSVAPGAVNKVPVSFLVPPDPTPLDVYFLVDTTNSMSPAILGLQHSIVALSRDLRKRLGLLACFGVGGVKDFDPTSTYVFQTFLPVSPCDTSSNLTQVTTAAGKLVQGGGGDVPEAQTLGLSLAVSGKTSVDPPVPIPQPANFRPGAFKVIVYISDAGSHQGGGYPTIPDVITTLNSADVKIVSIAFQHGASGDINGAMSMMTQLAIGTGSFAPPSGVDCNGDGGGQYGDLGPGAPLVCEEGATTSSDGSQMVNMEPALFGLLLGVKDPGTVAVSVSDPQHALRGPIQGATSLIVNMKYESGLKFTLPVGCSPSQYGKTLHIHLTPYIRSQAWGTGGDVDVICKSPPKLPSLPPVAAAVPLIVVPFARPPVAVPPPIPPNPPAQPPANLNPNAGMAREEQQQPQLAMAAQDAAAAEGEDTEVVEMSAMRNPSSANSDAAFLLGAGVLMAGAVGCQMHLRRRNAHARQGR